MVLLVIKMRDILKLKKIKDRKLAVVDVYASSQKDLVILGGLLVLLELGTPSLQKIRKGKLHENLVDFSSK